MLLCIFQVNSNLGGPRPFGGHANPISPPSAGPKSPAVYPPPTNPQSWGQPNQPKAYAPPSNQYAPPSNQYGPPSNQYAPPSNQYSPPSNQYAPQPPHNYNYGSATLPRSAVGQNAPGN